MKKLLLCVVSVIASCSDVCADVVKRIQFKGLDRVEVAAIEDCISIQPNKEYSQIDIDESIKSLYRKEFFSHIKFEKHGDTLVVICQERPMVDKVVFEGNDAASDDSLKIMLHGRVGEGKLFSLSVIKDILSDLQLAYRSLGYYAAKIQPKVVRRDGNKVDLIFEINEGSKTTVKKIVFVGNKNFSDNELKDIMETKEEKIWRFWSYESHVYREDKVDVDIESLTAFYRNNGYPFFMVVSTSAEMSFDKQSHYCTFYLEEGDKYTIDNVNFSSKIKKIDVKDFAHLIGVSKGMVYNEALINACKDKIRQEVSLKDNPFVDVLVDIKYDKNKKTADISYSIVESPKLFIERIEIVGNVRTLDRVIRREFTVHEGDALNVYKVQRTVERLKGIGYFEDVQISEKPGSAPDKKILIVQVKDKESTAQLKFGANVSDSDGFGGFIGVTEDNLFGTGQSFSADAFWMQKYYGGKVMLFEPRLFDKNFGAGISIGASRCDRKKEDESVTRSAYISPFLRYTLSPNLSHRISVSFSHSARSWWDKEHSQLHKNVPANVANAPLMKDEYGSFVCSDISSTLTYAEADNPYDPRSGYDISLTNSYAGLLGDVKYFKNEIHANYYHPVSKKVTFIVNAGIGHVYEQKNTRSCDRYALGGDSSLRGFDSFGVGTRDKKNNSVGGNRFWNVSFMLKAPLSTREIGMNGVVFFDVGSVWGTKYAKDAVHDSSSVRASIGVAIEWARSPIGMPMSFVFGFPLKKTSFDKKQMFTLSGFM